MSEAVIDRIRRLLADAGVTFRELEHPPTRTSAESAAVRGEPLEVGAKAILLKTDETFRLFVLPANAKLDSQAVKRELGVRKTRFATPGELLERTGLVSGAVPPFGRPVLPFDLFADPTVGAAHGRVAFNAGSLTHSMVLATTDWERAARPTRFAFAVTDPPADPDTPPHSKAERPATNAG